MAVACSPSGGLYTAGVDWAADAAPSCNTSADCADAGAFAKLTCLQGHCTPDECLADSDCASGMLCACNSEISNGLRVWQNLCMATQCRLDSDCGTGEVCSPSNGSYCGGLQGFFCHTPSDTCLTNSDCCGATPTCAYQSAVGHWACQALSVCAG
jgi:Cys-rich repeat protein